MIEIRWFVNHLANPLVRLLLESPAHGVLSSRLLLITFSGQKTKRVYTIPVGYVKGELAIYVVAGGHERKTWWRGFRTGATVKLHLKGRDVPATADIVSSDAEPEVVMDAARAYFRALPSAARSMGVRMAPDGTPNAQDLRSATEDQIIIRLRADA